MWLTPRLPSFRNAHPEIAIEFETSLGDHHEVNPARRDFDVWIAFVVGEAHGLGPDDRRLMQSGLASLGFDPGSADGVFGRRTRAAITAWQKSVGIPVARYLDAAGARLPTPTWTGRTSGLRNRRQALGPD